VFRVAFVEPRIPPNTGNAIRMVAATGAELHLIGPLGFDLSDAKLRRAGLDYHDLATVAVHADLETAWTALLPARVFAFTARATTSFAEIAYRPGDVLLFGPEPDGLADEVLNDARVTQWVRIPMLAGRRSLNLSNAAAVAVYEAWRQHGFAGSQPVGSQTTGDQTTGSQTMGGQTTGTGPSNAQSN
jgi:tRNA (cytidine/uridine-2'-O-)-methyltransferase